MSYHNSVSSLGGALNSLFKHLLSEIHTLSLNTVLWAFPFSRWNH